MADQDKDLVHLFVRDLDDIDLPARERWRPTSRKESHLMKTGRYVLYASAVAAVLVLALLASFGLRDRDQVAASPSPTSPTSPAASAPIGATVPSGATASPIASPASGRYVSAGLGYSIETPPPWHRSICSPAVTQQNESGGDVFVPVSARDETSSDIGAAYTTLGINVEANPQGLSPRQWAQQDRSGFAGQQIEDVVYADRPAARKGAPGTPLATYFVANGGRMYKIDPLVRPPLETATEQTLVRMIESFRFLTEAEQAAARAALREPPAGTRTPERVADGVAAAMAAKNVDALAAFLAPCVTTAGENAGGITVSREKYVDDLRAAFAAGLVVTVRPRPLETDRGLTTVASTWQDARGSKERKLMLRERQKDLWDWWGTIERF
jgi:hypothetical protein